MLEYQLIDGGISQDGVFECLADHTGWAGCITAWGWSVQQAGLVALQQLDAEAFDLTALTGEVKALPNADDVTGDDRHYVVLHWRSV